MCSFLILPFFILSVLQTVSSSPARVRSQLVPAAPDATEPASHVNEWLGKRQAFAPVTTCGYVDGDPSRARTAGPGHGCRVDTANGLWGFCPTSVIMARDCGLAGLCVDSHSCKEGCGRLFDRTDITTFSCEATQFCSTALLINGPDQSFEYIACGKTAKTDSLLAVPNTAETTTTSTSSSASSTSLASTTATSVSETLIAQTSIAQASKSPASSSSTPSGTLSPSSTSDSTAAPSEQATNIGAVVGGVLGGLTVICLTILGVLLIRRKRGATEQPIQPLENSHNDRNDLNKTAEMSAHDSKYITKGYHWDSSHGPVELNGGHHVQMEPVELSGQEK